MKNIIYSIVCCSSIIFAGLNIANATTNPTPIIGQYFASLGASEQTWNERLRSDTPLQEMNRLYIAFGKIVQTDDNHFTIQWDTADNSDTRPLQLIQAIKAANPTAEIFITVGGDDGSNSFGGAVNDSQFVDNVVAFLQKYNLTGIDIDWETDVNSHDYMLLIQNLHTEFSALGGSSPYKVTVDAMPYPFGGVDYKILATNIDQLNIMSYGTGLSLDDLASQFIAVGMPARQIIGMIETEADFDDWGGTVDTLGDEGTIAQKSNYALTNSLGGMAEWRLDNDYATTSDSSYPTYQGANALWKYMGMSGS